MHVDGATRTLRLTLLGGFNLVRSCGRTEIVLPVGAQRLLAFLAMHPHPVQRGHVAGVLWPDACDGRSAANLRSSLWRLRRLGQPVVAAHAGHLRLDDNVAVDVREIHAVVQRLTNPVGRLSIDVDPLLLTGELLPSWEPEDWLLFERERLRQLCLHGLDALCAGLLELGRYGDAIGAALAAVRCEPLRERSHRLLIAAHLAEGNPSEALRQFQWYERLVRQELGIRPSSQITDLIDPLRRVV